MVKINQLVIKFPQINELDMNPILVFTEAEGISAIDVKIMVSDPNVKPSAPAHHE